MTVLSQNELWSGRFRGAYLLSVVVAIAWTVALILPFDPFSSLLPVMIGGEAGTWLLLGYVVYLSVAVGAFAGLSAVLSELEREARTPNSALMWVSLVTLIAGVNTSCLLLGYAGAFGGYAQTIQHLPGSEIDGMLNPFVDVIRITTATSVLGALAALLGIASARGGKAV